MLLRGIELNKFNYFEAVEFYLKQCDKLDQNFKNVMSFQTFSVISKENKLFGKKARDLFANSDDSF